jgi:hypothetical protein
MLSEYGFEATKKRGKYASLKIIHSKLGESKLAEASKSSQAIAARHGTEILYFKQPASPCWS